MAAERSQEPDVVSRKVVVESYYQMGLTPPITILELRSVRGTGGGPEKTILLGAAQSDRARFAVTVCYLRDARDSVFHIDSRAAALGVDYIEVVERHSFDWRVWPQLRRIVRERRIQIVHSHDYKTDLIAVLLARMEGVIPLATVHGWTGDSLRERFIYYPFHKRLLRHFPLAIAVSPLLRSELLRTGSRPDQVRVVLNGIDHRIFIRDPEQYRPARQLYGVALGELVLGSVGRLEQQKRFDLLIQAFARVQSRWNARLLIAGEGSKRASLQKLIDDLGMGGHVTLVGLEPDVNRFHNALDLFVQSSDWEGTPNVVLEAMAMETPIVATEVGGTSALAHHGVHALLVAPRDVDGLARAVDAAFEDPASTSQRVARARQRVEGELSFETRMKAVESIYEELAGQRRLRS